MNLTPMHLHLMLNHVPLLGTIGVALLLGIGLRRRNRDLTRLALGFTVLVALMTIPVYFTGDPAEHELRDFDPKFDRDLVHEHEEQGEAAFIAVLVTGAAAIGALWLGRSAGDTRLAAPVVVLVGLLVCFGLLAVTALKGGQIRHPELRISSPAVPPPATE